MLTFTFYFWRLTVGSAPDRLKVLLQAGRADGVVSGVRAMYADGGWRAFWRGNGINVIKIVPEVS